MELIKKLLFSEINNDEDDVSFYESKDYRYIVLGILETIIPQGYFSS